MPIQQIEATQLWAVAYVYKAPPKRGILPSCGQDYKVVEATSREEAIKIFREWARGREGAPDYIIIDSATEESVCQLHMLRRCNLV